METHPEFRLWSLRPARTVGARYGVAVLATVAAALLHWLLGPWLGEFAPCCMLYPLVAVAVYFGGLGPALLSIALAPGWIFMPHPEAIAVAPAERFVRVLTFVGTSLLVAGFGEAMRRARFAAERHARAATEARQKLARTMESITDCFYTMDREWRVTYVNAQAASYCGLPKEAILGRVLWQLLPPLAGSEIEAQFRKALATQWPAHFEALSPLTHKWVEVHAYPSAEGLSVYFQNIDARKRAEAIVKSQRELLQRLIDTIPVMITIYNPCLRDFQLNRECQRVLGWSSEEAGKVDLMAHCYPDPQYREEVRQFMQSTAPGWRDFQVRAKDGSVVESTWANIRLSDDTLVGVGIDLRGRKAAEQQRAELLGQLQESQEILRVLLDAVPESALLLDPEGKVLALNGNAAAAMGATVEELVGANAFEHLPPEVAWTRRQRFEQVLRTGQPVEFEDRRDGRWIESFVHPVLGADGQVKRLAVFGRDITERKEAEAAVRQSREQLQTIIDTVPALISYIDRDFIYRLNNRAYEHWFQKPGAEITGKPMAEVLGSAIFERIRPRLQQALAGEVVSFDDYFPFLTGGDRWVNGVYMPHFSDDSRVDGVVILANDITERKRAEEALRASEERLSLAQRAARVGVFDWDVPANQAVWTRETEEIFGLAPGSFEGNYQGWSTRVHQEDLPRLEAFFKEWLASDHPEEQWEYRFLRPDGQVRWIASRAQVMRDAAGKPLRMVGTNVDITERKQAEEALRISEERLRLAAHVAGFGYYDTDVPKRKSFWSPELKAIFGLAPDARVQFALHPGRIDPADRPRVREKIAASCDPAGTGQFYDEHRIRRLDGAERWLLVIGQTIFAGEGAARRAVRGVGIAMDITERKQIEQALLQARLDAEHRAAELEAVLRAVPALVFFAHDPQCQQMTGSLATYDFLRLPPGTNLSKSAPPEERTTRWRSTRDGREVPPAELPVQQAAQGREVRDCELHLVFDDGSERTIFGHATPLWGKGDQPLGAVGAFIDITERKRAEAALHDAKQQLAHANGELERKVQERTARLQDTIAELEHFSYSITHDMRAPLRAMSGFARCVLEECAGCHRPEVQDFLKRIVNSAGRMDRLIVDALNYSKVVREELPLEPVAVEALIRGMLDSYPMFQPPQAEVAIDGELPPVWGNLASLTQCVSNLLGNAVKFVAPGQAPRVTIWAEAREGRVRLWFADNGIGIPPEVQPRIFDMFQRGHAGYEGTGIGLAIVRKAVERMGGQVGVESEEGRGSRFWLELKGAERLSG